MTLVDNDVLPRHLTQGGLIIEYVLVGGEDDMEFVILDNFTSMVKFVKENGH